MLVRVLDGKEKTQEDAEGSSRYKNAPQVPWSAGLTKGDSDDSLHTLVQSGRHVNHNA